MKPAKGATVVLLAIAALATVPALAAAQDPVTSFDRLNARLKVGDMVWVTDAQGREIEGRVQHIAPDAVTLDGSRTLRGSDVTLIRAREHDSVKNGTLIGLGVGGALGLAWCLAAAADDSPHVSTRVECTEGFTAYGALGTLLGVVIDATIPGKMRVAYRAPAAPGPSTGHLSTGLIVTSHAKGVAVSFSF
jgi:hypothetical protein